MNTPGYWTTADILTVIEQVIAYINRDDASLPATHFIRIAAERTGRLEGGARKVFDHAVYVLKQEGVEIGRAGQEPPSESIRDRIGEALAEWRNSAEDNAHEEWSDDELRAACESYLRMREAFQEGESVNKAAEYRALANRFPSRTAKAFEFRAQNISHVLDIQGRSWVPGLRPAKNVGVNIAVRIEAILADLEGRSTNPVVAFEQAVRSARVDSKNPPTGTTKPPTVESVTTSFARSPEVKAWVLNEADGECEGCGEAAPFVRSDGEPFLEVHHVHYLSEGGPDTVSNAVAVCPNCHRALHHSRERAELAASLYRRIDRLSRD